MIFTYLDASALAKRYLPELGSLVVDHLFARVPVARMIVLSVGWAEVASILVRKRNAGHLLLPQYSHAVNLFRGELSPAAAGQFVAVTALLAEQAVDLIDRYSVNSTDAILLRSALDLAAHVRPAGDDLLLVASDKRLLTAAQAEGLAAFNPEAQSAADLDALLGP